MLAACPNPRQPNAAGWRSQQELPFFALPKPKPKQPAKQPAKQQAVTYYRSGPEGVCLNCGMQCEDMPGNQQTHDPHDRDRCVMGPLEGYPKPL